MTNPEVLIYGVIGLDVDARQFASEVASIDADAFSVRINSPGGDLYDGLAMLNALRAHPAHVTTVVDGMAASAASFIAIGGGDTVIARKHSELMIHNASLAVQGNAAELSRKVDDLNRVSESMAQMYAEKAGSDIGMWREAMSAETWFTAEEALEAGLVDEVSDAREGKKAQVSAFSMSAFHYAGRADAPPPPILAHKGHNHKEENMAFLNAVAHKLGVNAEDMSEDQVLAALDEVLAEQTGQINVQVELSYPEEVDVKPTDKATVEPASEVPEGVSFTLGEVPDGWSGEVDEATGVLTVTAPEGAVGDTAEFVVTAAGGDESVEFTVTATIVAAAEDADESPAPDAPADDTVTLDKGVYEALLARADKGDRADAEGAQRAAASLVNTAISQGKVLAAKREALTARAVEDFDGMKAYFSKLASGTVPVTEQGRGGSDEERNNPDDRKVALAKGRAAMGLH